MAGWPKDAPRWWEWTVPAVAIVVGLAGAWFDAWDWGRFWNGVIIAGALTMVLAVRRAQAASDDT